MKHTSTQSRFRMMAFALFSFVMVNTHSVILAAQDSASSSTGVNFSWNQETTAAGSASVWKGISSIYGLVFGLFWVGAAVSIGMGWFKFKKGDVQAALLSLGGGAGLGVTPFLIQWFRSLGGGGGLF